MKAYKICKQEISDELTELEDYENFEKNKKTQTNDNIQL